ncbi:SPW repeat protein [Streptomyces sp. NRRL F-2580]|uniref:SPW repeat protein n=1 Tax=Streptomyces sp. NRRL F-2580 TaxID=1463841 RepID=UPI001F1D6949|nr:SPW repeat protein [Streptomyces sp. NRRL F-2580]
MRARFERATTSPVFQVTTCLGLIAGLYLAVSPWVVGFHDLDTLTINNLVLGIGYVLPMTGLSPAYDRTHSMAWMQAIVGVWTIVAPWVVSGEVATMGTIANNSTVGAIGLFLALSVAALGRHASYTHPHTFQR